MRLSIIPQLLSASLVLVATRPAAAQSPATATSPARPLRTQLVTIDPISFQLQYASGGYERAFGQSGIAVGIAGAMSYENQHGGGFDADAFRSADVQLKYYPAHDGLRGFALGASAGVLHQRRSSLYSSVVEGDRPQVDYHYSSTRTAPTLGATLDYHWLIGGRRHLLVGAGVSARTVVGSARTQTSLWPEPTPLVAGSPLRASLDRTFVEPRVQLGFAF